MNDTDKTCSTNSLSPQDVLGVKSKSLLSINGPPQMREPFKGFHIRPVSLPIRSQKARSAPAGIS
jgi:hypothetical protein